MGITIIRVGNSVGKGEILVTSKLLLLLHAFKSCLLLMRQNQYLWLVVLGFNATLTAKVISWRSVFPGFLTPVLLQLFFPKPSTTFLTCFCSGERRKYDAEKVRLNRGSNSQPPGHERDTLTAEPPGLGEYLWSKGLILIHTRACRCT